MGQAWPLGENGDERHCVHVVCSTWDAAFQAGIRPGGIHLAQGEECKKFTFQHKIIEFSLTVSLFKFLDSRFAKNQVVDPADLIEHNLD